MPIEAAFGSVLRYLREHSNDPSYLTDYYSLAPRGISTRVRNG